jgi:hypothetical protein
VQSARPAAAVCRELNFRSGNLARTSAADWDYRIFAEIKSGITAYFYGHQAGARVK